MAANSWNNIATWGSNLEPAAKLAAQARPRSGWESLQADAQEQLDEILR